MARQGIALLKIENEQQQKFHLPSWEPWGECSQYRRWKEQWWLRLSSVADPSSSHSPLLQFASSASKILQLSSSKSSPPLVKPVQLVFGRCQMSIGSISRPSQHLLLASWNSCSDSLPLLFPNWRFRMSQHRVLYLYLMSSILKRQYSGKIMNIKGSVNG